MAQSLGTTVNNLRFRFPTGYTPGQQLETRFFVLQHTESSAGAISLLPEMVYSNGYAVSLLS